MKSNIYLVSIKLTLILILFTPVILHCQTVSENIVGISTNFTLTSDSIVLNNDKQILIRRGVKKHDLDRTYEAAYGYGFQTYHLEFISKNKIQNIKKDRRKIQRQQFYELYFTNKNGLKFNVALSNSDVNQLIGFLDNQKIYAYSINLNDIPLILLDEIDEIGIVRIQEK